MKLTVFVTTANLRSRRAVLSLVVTLCLFLQVNCDRKGAIDLATLGMETGQTLTSYYESLAKDTNETWDMENLFIALLRHPSQSTNAARNASDLGSAFDADDIKLLKERLDAINSRSAMAKQMIAMYSALKDYSSYDSGARIEAAAGKLSGALFGLVPLPAGINPATIVGAVAGDLARWNQQKKIEELTKNCQELIMRLDELFKKEAKAYTAIAQENRVTMTAIAKQLINKEMVLTWQLLDHVPASFGLKWVKEVTNSPVTDDPTKKAFISIIEHRNNTLVEQAKSATENIEAALANLVATQEKFLNKKPLEIVQVKTFLERARFYISEIQKLKDSYQQTKEKTDG
jgi:hypothetical protein